MEVDVALQTPSVDVQELGNVVCHFLRERTGSSVDIAALILRGSNTYGSIICEYTNKDLVRTNNTVLNCVYNDSILKALLHRTMFPRTCLTKPLRDK